MDDVKSKIRAWMDGTDTGMSSKSLAREAAGIPEREISHPHDTADLGRCLRLIARIPEVRAAVDGLAAKDAYWKALAPEWDRLTRLYIDATATEKWKPVYSAMRAVLDPVEKADKRVIRLGNGITMRLWPMSVEALTTQNMTLHCAGDHEWTEAWPMPMRAEAFTRRLKAASKCPSCGKKVFFGPNTRALDAALFSPLPPPPAAEG